jgi:hypothetical protein
MDDAENGEVDRGLALPYWPDTPRDEGWIAAPSVTAASPFYMGGSCEAIADRHRSEQG